MKSKRIVVMVAASVVLATTASVASAGTPLVVNLAALPGATVAAPLAATAPSSECLNREVTSSFHEPHLDDPEPNLPLEDMPADAVSVPTWSGSFTTDGTNYPYTMVGTDPAVGSATTHVPVEIIPLRIDFPNNCVLEDGSAAADIEASPLFEPGNFPAGNTQYLDDIQRSNFWSTVSTASPGYHLLLDASDFPAVTLHVPASQGLTFFNTDTGRTEGIVAGKWFNVKLHILLDALHVSPTTLAVFVPYNTYVTDQNPDDCLTVGCAYYSGYHSAVLNTANTHAINTYALATYEDFGDLLPAQFDGGVDVLSHEILEWANDPFDHGARVRGQVTFFANVTPAWASPYFTDGSCSSVLEVADPLEGAGFLGVHAIGSSTVYLFADAAFLSWFARQSPSTALGGLYDAAGIFPTYSDTC